jgi:CheY-like chemotaxis protein
VPGSKRVVVIDDEPHIRRLLEQMLHPPDFEVHAFADPRDALMKLHDLAPDLIVCDVMMPDMDGRTFLQVVKRSSDLKDVPFIFLSAVRETEEVVQAYAGGADDYVEKPFNLARLMAKVRAVLRMSERRRADALTGQVRGEGTLPLLKFCEDNHLTGRLTVFAPGQERWVECLGGEMVGAGGTPAEPDVDPLDALLAVKSGTYRIEQRRLDRQAVDDALARYRAEAAGAAAAPAPDGPAAAGEVDELVAMPEGRLSSVMVRGSDVQVQTEAANRPHFTVTTILAREGQVLRKIESAWLHALKRREDVELARAQIERQHDRVLAMLRELGGEAPDPAAASVDPSLLAWALSFVVEQVRHHLGAVMAVALLRRTHRALVREHPALRVFRLAEDGRVQADPQAAPPAALVPAVAAWTSAFIGAAAELVERVRALKLRSITRMMESELERVGFYTACQEAQARPGRADR